MKTISHSLLGTALLAGLFISPVLAEQAGPKALLERSAAAMGGTAAFTKIKTLVVRSSMEMPAAFTTMLMVSYYKAPNLIYVESDIPLVGKARQGYDGKTGWANDPIQGYHELTGIALEQLIASCPDYLVRLPEYYRRLELLPDNKVGERPARVVKGITPLGAEEVFFLDAQTFLPIRMDLTVDSGPAGKLPTQVTLEDWKEIPGTGAKFPNKTVTNTSAAQMIETVESVEVNVPLDDALFAPKK